VQGHHGEDPTFLPQRTPPPGYNIAREAPVEGFAGPPSAGRTDWEAPRVEPLATKKSTSSASLPVARPSSLPATPLPLSARGAPDGDLLGVPRGARAPQTLPPPRSLASEAAAAIEAAIADIEGPAKPEPPAESLAVAAVAAAVEGRSRAAPAALPQESASPFGVGGGMRSVTREELIQSGCLRVLQEEPEPERRPVEMTIGFGAAYNLWARPEGELAPTGFAVPSSSPRLVHIVA